MTIKALHGGKLLCLMAAVAGAMTLGSCKDDDDDPEPTPAPVPVDTTPQKVTFPDEYKFRINNSTPVAFNAGDSIKANTLLSNGVNSDTISIDVILRNKTMVDPASVSLSLANNYLGSVKISQTPSITDSIYSVSLPAIEGNYSLTINGKTRNFVVAGSGKDLSAISRNLSNCYTTAFDSQNTKVSDFTFSPYTEDEDGTTHPARLAGNGSFMILTEDEYNNYISDNKAELSDIKMTDAKTSIFNVTYFLYRKENNNYLCKVLSFEGPSLKEATSIKLSVTF